MKKMIAENEMFSDVIFTDQSSVMLEAHRKQCYRRTEEPRKLQPRPKHPVKVHVWGGISKRGATSVAIFTGIMTATRYTDYLECALLPFTQEVLPDGQQFHDPKHCARHTKAFFSANNINLWLTTPESPDLNPIENVWGSMKKFLCNKYKPRGLEDLTRNFGTSSPAKCTRYLNHLNRVMPVVIEKAGGPSGF